MAVQPQRIQRQMVQTQEADDSGSKWGALLGALAAGAAVAAAPATGGATLPVALAAAQGGSSLGGMLGGAIGDKKEKYEMQKVPGQAQIQSAPETENTAMARRLADESRNKLMALTQAENALAKVPPSIAQEYAAPIQQARSLAMKQYGVA